MLVLPIGEGRGGAVAEFGVIGGKGAGLRSVLWRGEDIKEEMPQRRGHEAVEALEAWVEEEQERGPGCCAPSGCLREAPGQPAAARLVDTLSEDAVRVTCNNEQCPLGSFMHRDCFEAWERGVLQHLRGTGRARGWSERQRLQNLWTRKGYDLAFKACGCRCGRGHLKKDLDWVSPATQQQQLAEEGGAAAPAPLEETKKRRRRRNRQNNRPALGVVLHHGGGHNNNQQPQQEVGEGPRGRAGSLSSSTASGSPPPASSSSASPSHGGGKKKSKFDFFSDRSRHGSGGNGIFSRRQDFSSFNSLPRHKLNSYHIKMEDEGNHGNDDTRCFILSTLAAQHMSKVTCLLCHAPMPVFDRYPLLDGTFFLSPRCHGPSCLQVRVEGLTQYLSAVCMGCLEGSWPPLRCRHCNMAWDGSSLILGTMYSYDIFAATPCCANRLKCNGCEKAVLHPHQRLPFFSDYSHEVVCPHCGMPDTHFVKPLSTCFIRRGGEETLGWP
ncbi:headcase protein isoform X2 [Ischnura elegans]|uniref:headcase protein isoform X2 n=1 Tax=Ischnura elegans TaxID=197161 RepID=UPI001ED89E70|nr:headcase protein isoform X2 [Ischnura elegans]